MAIRRVWNMGWICDRTDVFTSEYLKKRCLRGLKSLHDFMG